MTPDDRVQLAILGHLGQVYTVLLKVLTWNLRIGIDPGLRLTREATGWAR